jgi:hypothetical protein
MSIAGGILMILSGLAIMSFGLFLFYALLPLLFGLVGFDIGLLLGRWLTGDVGVLAIILGIIVAAILAVASYALEPYRRILIGASGGFLFGLSLAAAFGLENWLGGSFGILLAVVCGLIGGFLVPYFFDLLIVIASAAAGASLVVAGAHLILPRVALFDHVAGGPWPRLITLILAILGIGWQFSNIAKWIQAMPMLGDASATSARDQGRTPPP